MSKQEDIREGLAKPICKLCGQTEKNECNISEGGCVELAECLDEQVAFLHSQGLVIKVRDKPLPIRRWFMVDYAKAQGYTLTENLIVNKEQE